MNVQNFWHIQKITFLDVLDYSEYSDTNISKKKIFSKTASSVRKQNDIKIIKITCMGLFMNICKTAEKKISKIENRFDRPR